MASIKENRKNGRIVSYSFTACIGRDENGKQIRRYHTWTPPKGIGQSKAPKEAERQAVLWEQQIKSETTISPASTQIQQRDDFVEFISQTWFPLQVSGNNRKAKTVQFYEGTTKTIKEYFKGRVLQEITALDKCASFLSLLFVVLYLSLSDLIIPEGAAEPVVVMVVLQEKRPNSSASL